MPTFRAFKSCSAPATLLVLLLAGTDMAADDKVAATYLTPNLSQVLIAPEGQFRSLGQGTHALTPDGKTLARVRADGEAKVWELPSGKKLSSLATEDATIYYVALAPDGRTLLTIGKKQVTLWDVTTRKEVRRFESPQGDFGIFALAFSPNGKVLASGCRNGPVRLWEVATGKQRLALPDSRADGALAFSPNGAALAGVTPNGDTIDFWDARTGQARSPLRGHQGGAYSVAFAADGRRLASASQDTTVLLWDVTALVRPASAPLPSLVLSKEQLRDRWAALADGDAARGHEAMRALVGSSAQAVPWLRERVRPVKTGIERRKLVRLIADLGSEEFAVRDEATRELEKLGELAEAALRAALAARPELEPRRRMERLLEKLNGQVLSLEALRALRALEVLEQAGTAQAKALLAELAKGAPDARLTQEARAALERLRKWAAPR